MNSRYGQNDEFISGWRMALVITAGFLAGFASAFFGFMAPVAAEWSIDFSRRVRSVGQDDLRAADQTREPASVRAGEMASPGEVAEDPAVSGSNSLLGSWLAAGEPVQDLVILNTEKGFVPARVRVRRGGRYKIHVVNVNEKEKNVSFILDGFSEHHATYFGRVKTFMLEPKKEGVFAFQSPETSAEGRLIVFNPEVSFRAPAGESAK